MAIPAPVTMDTLITINVQIEGSNRRFKLPLKELGVNTFENKVRAFLQVPTNQELKLERYSDSLASYVQLDSSNPQVYKTLFRAAKAKLKLRVKATVVSHEEDTAPAVQQPQATTSTTTLVSVDQVGPSESQAPTPKAPEPEQSADADGEAPLPRPFEVSSRPWGKVNPLQSKLAFRAKNAPAASSPMCSWSVYCNQCDKPMANEHYHCQVCDDGDYDLCATCVGEGHHCHDEEHWLVKRYVHNGRVMNSISETFQAKPKVNVEPVAQPTQVEKEDILDSIIADNMPENHPEFQEPEIPCRTCNSCIKVHPETEFVTCKDCEDYDLCIPCHVGGKHGHHPSHAFEPATAEASIGPLAEFLCTPGRNIRHAAVCDGCDKYIYGIRHKCLNCPDWDFCGKCIKNSKFIHPGHRFVPIYEPLAEPRSMAVRHHGIYCDGPLCKDKDTQVYMQGVRYKCAVCHDTDFCASCEASPSNRHNRTHPLIMFKSPVRNVSVTTMGEDKHGAPMAAMGDQGQKRSTSTETTPVQSANAATQVQTIADLKPSEESILKESAQVRDILSEPIQEKIKVEDLLSMPVPQTPEVKTETSSAPTEISSNELIAHFVRDTVTDGTKVLPGALFTQVWTLRNPGPQVWPTGCSVRYVGGDNMLNVDDSRPSSTAEINEATESNVVGRAVEVGEEISFRVLMKAPKREGTAISYWRLKDAEGTPFGHRLWCHIDVSNQVVSSSATPEPPVESVWARTQAFGYGNPVPKLTEDHMRKHIMMYQEERRKAQAASPTANKTLDEALKRHAEVRAQVIENMRRATDRMNAELERMGSHKEESKPVELATQPEAPKASVESVPETEAEAEVESETRSTMIFPTLEKESPVSSTHEAVTAPKTNAPTETAETETLLSPSVKSDLEFFEDAETVDYSDESDQGFATDEEYDILDASDQELA